MKLAELIALYRAEHGLSQRQFALMCDLSNGYISMLERELNPATKKPVTPTMPQLKKLASGMGITVMELLERVDDMPIDLGGAGSFDGSLTMLETADGLDPEELELIRKYRCLDDRGKAVVLSILNHEYDSLPGEKAHPAPKEA